MKHKTYKDALAMVASFMKAMGQPVSAGWENKNAIKLGINLIHEETKELKIESAALVFCEPDETAKENFIKELADLLYVCYWTAAAIGIDINEALHRVHESNMSKLDPETGKALKNSAGKVLKGPHYHAPDLADIVGRVPISL